VLQPEIDRAGVAKEGKTTVDRKSRDAVRATIGSRLQKESVEQRAIREKPS
jgi:hypothetical protein